MNIGKVPNTLLDSLILKPIRKFGVKRKEVLSTPSVGEDCAAIKINGSDNKDIVLLSTDPITGAVNDIGKLAVHINANDIASAGGEPVGIMITALLPPETTPENIEKIMSDVYTNAAEVGIAVLGGHTEITAAVNKPILSCTIVGKCKKMISSGGSNAGDKVIMTKYAGLEGTGILASDKRKYLLNYLEPQVIDTAVSFLDCVSVVIDGRIATEENVTSMHDVTEGGILGACYEIAMCSGNGIKVYTDNIPIKPETKQIANVFEIDPLRLISSGCMLMTHPQPEILIKRLNAEGINATVIGEITDNTDEKLIVTKDGTLPLGEPDSDQLYKIIVKEN